MAVNTLPQPATDREALLLLRERVEHLAGRVTMLITMLVFLVTPVYAAAVWTVMAHLFGPAK